MVLTEGSKQPHKWLWTKWNATCLQIPRLCDAQRLQASKAPRNVTKFHIFCPRTDELQEHPSSQMHSAAPTQRQTYMSWIKASRYKRFGKPACSFLCLLNITLTLDDKVFFSRDQWGVKGARETQEQCANPTTQSWDHWHELMLNRSNDTLSLFNTGLSKSRGGCSSGN